MGIIQDLFCERRKKEDVIAVNQEPEIRIRHPKEEEAARLRGYEAEERDILAKIREVWGVETVIRSRFERHFEYAVYCESDYAGSGDEGSRLFHVNRYCVICTRSSYCSITTHGLDDDQASSFATWYAKRKGIKSISLEVESKLDERLRDKSDAEKWVFLLPVIQGYIEGKTVQVFRDETWIDIDSPDFSANGALHFRIKPDDAN